MKASLKGLAVSLALGIFLTTIGCSGPKAGPTAPASKSESQFAQDAIELGKQVFRYETFGDESFWGGSLRLHESMTGARLGGFGPGLSPNSVLAIGLKIDSEALPPSIAESLQERTLDLNDPLNTLALLEVEAVVGIRAIFDPDRRIHTVGITCAFCHSTVDDSLAPGIGKRLDGWPNRDLDVGAIIALSPNPGFLADRLGLDMNGLNDVLKSWGPGKYDAQLNMDGKAFRPDRKTGATLIPAIFGMAGVNLQTYTGWGSIPNWNAYVAVTQMRGKGSFLDPRLHNAAKFPLAVKWGEWNIALERDVVRWKIPQLHLYQLSLPAPKPPAGTYDEGAARRGQVLFYGKAGCAKCHVPPTFTEQVWPMHTGAEIGIDDFQSGRSPLEMYRTTPLKGLFAREKGGFYHDGRFQSLLHVVSHYDRHFRLGLTQAEREDLVNYLKSL